MKFRFPLFLKRKKILERNSFVSSRASGFSLVEVVVATSIISVSLLAIITLANQSLLISRRALNTYMASTLLEEGSEAVRSIRDGAWSNVSSLSAGTTYYPVFSTATNTWSLSTTPSNVGIFTRTVTVASVQRDSNDDIVTSGGTVDAGTKLVTVTLSWSESGAIVSKTLQVYVSNILS